MNIGQAITVFAVAALTDAIWARYIQCTADGKRWSGAFYSMMIAVFGTFVGIEVYNHDVWLAIPMCIGYFVGSAIAIKPKVITSDMKFTIPTDKLNTPK